MTPYQHQEFPKWIELSDGTRLIVNDADHEALMLSTDVPQLASSEDPTPHVHSHDQIPEPDIRDALRAKAIGLGIEFDGRWSVTRLQREIDAKLQEQEIS